MIPNTAFTWLSDTHALQGACDYWHSCEHIFVDTEFVRRTTFYPKLGLIQVADDRANYLIDTVAIDDLTAFAAVLENTAVLKVMHAASEDVDVFYSLFDLTPTPLFDTQIACGLAGLEYGMGFARMVEQLCGESLDKAETTSDWLARPLTERQCEYACADVAYLKPCYFLLKQKLDALQRYDWVLEDSQHMINNHVSLQPAESLYKRMKGTGRLNPRQLAACRALCAWRDETAKELDRPKARVVKDAEIILLAKLMPKVIEQFPNDVFGQGWLYRFAKPVINLLYQARKLDEAELPTVAQENRPETKALMTAMRDCVSAIATAQQLPEAALAGKKDLLGLMESYRLYGMASPEFSGWRWSVIGQELLEICRRQAA